MVSWEVTACFPAWCRAQNPLPHSRWRPALHHSLAGARLGDGTHYSWEMTPGSGGPAWPVRLANQCSSVRLIKPRESVPAPRRRVGRKPHAAGQASGQGGQATGKGDFTATQATGKLCSDTLENSRPSELNSSSRGVYQASFCLGPYHPQEPRLRRAPRLVPVPWQGRSAC